MGFNFFCFLNYQIYISGETTLNSKKKQSYTTIRRNYICGNSNKLKIPYKMHHNKLTFCLIKKLETNGVSVIYRHIIHKQNGPFTLPASSSSFYITYPRHFTNPSPNQCLYVCDKSITHAIVFTHAHFCGPRSLRIVAKTING